MDITECFNSNIPVRRASQLCGMSYSKALAMYTHLRMEEYYPSGIIKRNFQELSKIERDLFQLIEQRQQQHDDRIDEVIDEMIVKYSQFDALSITNTL